jgi:hypothetical protein
MRTRTPAAAATADHTIIQKGSKTTFYGERGTQGKTPIDLSSESINGVHRCPDDLPST